MLLVETCWLLLVARCTEHCGERMLQENSGCFNFTREEFEIITITKDVICGTSLIACFITVLLIAFMKNYRFIVHRFAMYLTVATFFKSLTFILMSVPVTYNEQLKRTEVTNSSLSKALCKATGFLIQYFGWVVMLVIGFTTFYLLLLAFRKLHEDKQKLKYELTGVLVSLLLPATFNWIPFIHDMYGLAGPWCWIEIGRQNCPSNFDEAVVYQFLLYYIPALLLAGLNSIFIATMIIILCKHARHRNLSLDDSFTQQRLYREALKEAIPILIVAIAYVIFYSLSFANRIIQTDAIGNRRHPVASLWVIHAVTFSSLQLMIPLGFILHPRNASCRDLNKRLTSLRKNGAYVTEFTVSAESADISEELVIRESSEHLAQPTYRSILEGQNLK